MAEHLDDILRILKAVAIGYGSESRHCTEYISQRDIRALLLDNTARQAKISLMKLKPLLLGRW